MVDLQLDKRLEKAQGKDGPEGEARMTFGEHIEELRGRLFKSILFLMVALVVCMVFYEHLVTFIIKPHQRAMVRLGAVDAKLMPGSYGGPIIAVMKLAFIISLFVTSPFVGYQLWSFISAGLYRNERKHVTMFAPISFLLFTAGCAFGYLVLIEYCLYGLANSMNFGEFRKIISNDYMFADYLGLVMTLTIVLGAVFQIPLIMVFLSKIGLVPPSFWNKWRRAAVIVNVVFAAIITPADIFTMVLVAVPMLVLYEIGVLVSFLLAPKTPQPAKT